MRLASQCFFIHSCIYKLILIISYLATFLGNNSLSKRMCHKAVNQSIHVYYPTSPNFNPYQSAYHRNQSTETALLCTLDHVYHSANAHKSTIPVSLDLRAA